LLNRDEVYDHAIAEELAQAMEERNTLAARVIQLNEIIDENEDLKQFVWTTAQGKSIAIHNIEDDHLKNILQHIFERGGDISKSLKAEARRRNIVIPETTFAQGVRLLGQARDVHNEDIGDPYDLG
jgi:hypothetical protein